MATKFYQIPLNTEIELVATRKGKVFKEKMIYEDALKIPKKKGWYYQYFQLDFCSM